MNSAIYTLFQFYILHFTNQITLKQSLAQKLNLIFKFSSIKRERQSSNWITTSVAVKATA